MTLADLSSLGSFISGVAVLISLIYVSVQIRQTERNQQTLLQQGTSSRGTQVLLHLSEPQIAELLVKAANADSDFTPVQAQQLAYALRASLLGFQDQFLLHKHSLIDPRQREGQGLAIQGLLAMPGARAIWTLTRTSFPPDFVRYVDALVSQAPVIARYDFSAQLNAAIRELKAAAQA